MWWTDAPQLFDCLLIRFILLHIVTGEHYIIWSMYICAALVSFNIHSMYSFISSLYRIIYRCAFINCHLTIRSCLSHLYYE
jgi:hypothetical protein